MKNITEITVKVKRDYKRGRKVYPVTYAEAGRVLGCTAGHLHQVVSGQRKSPRLLQEWRELCAEVERGLKAK